MVSHPADAFLPSVLISHPHHSFPSQLFFGLGVEFHVKGEFSPKFLLMSVDPKTWSACILLQPELSSFEGFFLPSFSQGRAGREFERATPLLPCLGTLWGNCFGVGAIREKWDLREA